MSKLSTASANIRATALGGMRCGLSGMRQNVVAPVTIYIGPGPTSMPPTLDGIKPVQHPEPSNVNPTAAKVAAAQAAAQARQLQLQRRRNQRASNKAAKVAAAPKARTIATSTARKWCSKAGTTLAKAAKAYAAENNGHIYAPLKNVVETRVYADKLLAALSYLSRTTH